jgi:hypothetical protein
MIYCQSFHRQPIKTANLSCRSNSVTSLYLTNKDLQWPYLPTKDIKGKVQVNMSSKQCWQAPFRSRTQTRGPAPRLGLVRSLIFIPSVQKPRSGTHKSGEESRIFHLLHTGCTLQINEPLLQRSKQTHQPLPTSTKKSSCFEHSSAFKCSTDKLLYTSIYRE